MMSEPPRTCPRCWHPALPAMVRCQSCGQILTRPGALPSSSTAVSALLEVSVHSSTARKRDATTAVLNHGTPAPAASEKLRIICPCGAAIRVSVALRGKRIKCPKCSVLVPVPVTRIHKHSSSKAEAPAIECLSAVKRPVEESAAESVATRNHESSERELKDEIELTANRPTASGTEASPRRTMSFFRLRKIRKLLETANVLSDENTIARRNALLELGHSRDCRALEILVEHSQDCSPIIRDGAITALGDCDDPQAVPAVLRALLDRNEDVVRAAFTALKKIGDRRVVRPLLRFGQERPEWRPLANDTLVRLGPRVVLELLNILQTNDAGLTLDAIVVLGRIGDKQAVSALIACLDHVSNFLKAHVTEALALIGDSRAVPQLLRALKDPHTPTRANAAAGLVRMSDPRSLRPLLKALLDDDGDVRGYAAAALGELGETKAIPELANVLARWKTLEHEDTKFLEAIVESLGKLGDTVAVPALIPLLKSQQHGVLLKTVLALKKLRDPSAAQALITLLHVPKPAVRRRVVETLGNSGDVSLVPVIGEVLRQDASREVRATAARSLGELKAREACPYLEEALREEFSIRCQAVIALGAIQERSTIPALMAMLKDAAPEVRYHAINAIAKFKDSKTLKALAVMLEDSDPMVRSGASKVIEELSNLVNEHKGVKEIVRRAKSRNYIESLIPKWVFLFVPTRNVALSGLAGLLLICLLGAVGYTLWVGPTTRVLVRGKVAELTMSPDGSTLVAERTMGMLEVWDVNGESVSQRFSKEGGRSPRFRARDGLVLVMGDSLIPWNLSGRPDPTTGWKEHRQPIVTLYTTPGGEFAATMDREGSVVVWDLEAGRKAGQLKLDPRFKQSLTVSPKGSLLAASNTTGDVAVWNVESGERIREIPRAKGAKPFVKLSFNTTETWLVGAEQIGGLSLFDLEAKSGSLKVKAVEFEHPIVPIEVRFLPDGKRVLAADAGGDIFVWDLESGESTVACKTGISPLEAFAMNSAGTQFAAGNSESTEVVIFSLETGKPIKRLDAK